MKTVKRDFMAENKRNSKRIESLACKAQDLSLGFFNSTDIAKVIRRAKRFIITIRDDRAELAVSNPILAGEKYPRFSTYSVSRSPINGELMAYALLGEQKMQGKAIDENTFNEIKNILLHV